MAHRPRLCGVRGLTRGTCQEAKMTKAIPATEVDADETYQHGWRRRNSPAGDPLDALVQRSRSSDGDDLEWPPDLLVVRRLPCARRSVSARTTLFPEGVLRRMLELDRKLARGPGVSSELSAGCFRHQRPGCTCALPRRRAGSGSTSMPRICRLEEDPGHVAAPRHGAPKEEAPEHGQYNVMQQLAYSGVTVLGHGCDQCCDRLRDLQAGAAQWWLTTAIFGGYESARADPPHRDVWHCPRASLDVHIVQVARAGFAKLLGDGHGLQA